MAKVPISRRRVARRRRPMYRRKNRLMALGKKVMSKKGFFRILRRAPEQQLNNSGTIGTISVVGGIVSYGTPVATSFTGYYNVPGSVFTMLNDIINPSDITNLFDNYRIKWIKIRVYCTSTTATAGGTSQLPSIIYNVDDDDVTIPTPNFLREKSGSVQRMFYPGKPVTIFWRPKVARQLNSGAGSFLGNEVATSPWINSTYPAVSHFGLKFAILDMNLNTTATAYTQLKWDFQYCIEAKDAQ